MVLLVCSPVCREGSGIFFPVLVLQTEVHVGFVSKWCQTYKTNSQPGITIGLKCQLQVRSTAENLKSNHGRSSSAIRVYWINLRNMDVLFRNHGRFFHQKMFSNKKKGKMRGINTLLAFPREQRRDNSHLVNQCPLEKSWEHYITPPTITLFWQFPL